MCHPNYASMTLTQRTKRRHNGDFLCDNTKITVRHSLDITGYASKMREIGIIDRDSTHYAISNAFTHSFCEIDLEYELGLHYSVNHYPSGQYSAWRYNMHFGFCDKADELVYELGNNRIIDEFHELFNNWIETKLIMIKLQGGIHVK